ncbi:hypothetical protein [Azovibrio restrictus]|uniref:hypothetical protein n=1 Tax=Azovibrio restrictus TaxID=146938 RepID=UPI0026EBA1DF|nr:hypothetical protein [Azovibrio restrictus]MDD3484168.1 hypothetical protein [Azovibrio restrictus]
MASFKGKPDSERVEYGYFRKVIVFLESEEDRLIIGDRWFFEDGEFDFKPADQGCGGGSSRVIALVAEARTNHFSAFGIVDRDALAVEPHWPTWWEMDDGNFHAARPLGEYIRVLPRWEIENYLLDPEVVEAVVANREGRPVRRGEDALQTIYRDINSVVSISAAVIAGRKHGIRVDDELNKIPADALPQQIEKHLGDAASCVSELTQRIREFGAPLPEGSAAHWERISRLLDGKRFLKRLDLCGRSLSTKEDRRLELADQARNKGMLIQEIKVFLDEFKREALV